MGELTEQAAQRIIVAYGEAFLRYVFALPEDKPIIEALQATSVEVVAILQSAMDQAPGSGSGDVDITMMASGNFGHFREQLGGSLANYLHQISGGNVEKVPSTKDPVVQAVRDIAHDVWPTLLLTPPSRGPRTFWMSSMSGVYSHPRTIDACKAFMADPKLAPLFPEAPSIDDASTLGDVIGVQANWMMSSGQGGSRQLISVIDAIIFNAAVLAQLDVSPLNHASLMSAIPKSIEVFRALASMKPVEVPAVIGIAGVRIDDSTTLKFGEDVLRAAQPVERNLLLSEADRVTSVFATKFAIQLLKVEAFKPSEPSDEFFKSWQKFAPRIQESHRTLQRRVDRVRLSLLLASEGAELLGTTEVSRFIADPTQPGGIVNWQMDPRVPASYELKEGQGAEVVRFHGLIQEKHPDSLDIAMKRILGAVSQRWDATDAFIDAVVVWENAFGTSTETTFRVTGAIAKLLEPGSADDRAKLQKELKGLYETRSRLVHGAKEPKPEEAWAQRERTIAIALDVLRKLYTERPDLLELSSDLRSAQLLLEG